MLFLETLPKEWQKGLWSWGLLQSSGLDPSNRIKLQRESFFRYVVQLVIVLNVHLVESVPLVCPKHSVRKQYKTKIITAVWRTQLASVWSDRKVIVQITKKQTFNRYKERATIFSCVSSGLLGSVSFWTKVWRLTLECLLLVKLIFRLVYFPSVSFLVSFTFPFATLQPCHRTTNISLNFIWTFIEVWQSTQCLSSKSDIAMYCYNWFVQLILGKSVVQTAH